MAVGVPLSAQGLSEPTSPQHTGTLRQGADLPRKEPSDESFRAGEMQGKEHCLVCVTHLYRLQVSWFLESNLSKFTFILDRSLKWESVLWNGCNGQC